MGQPVIEVRNLSKLYRLGAIGASSLRESVERLWLRWRRSGKCVALPGPSYRLSPEQRGTDPNTFWALKDVSFDIRPGEIVGIIGQNGAGKSTLLKILSRITEPTAGQAILRGRVGSLLEVGTGFHPELSGRENIYLNGAMLGMRTNEINRKLDEIIAFSEIEDFVDTPVKRYSSGMYVRLAFAVAAHLEPEILLVDEVLAVGDAAFQKKCLGKMDDVAKHGRTVLLVSHNMIAVQSLCPRVICVGGGRITADGPAAEIVQDYLQVLRKDTGIALDQRIDRAGDGTARIVSLKIESATGGAVHSSSPLKVTIGYRSDKALRRPKFTASIYNVNDTGIFALDSDAAGGLPETLPAMGEVTCVTEPINLTAGRCFMNVTLLKGGVVADYIPQAGVFDVESEDFFGSGKVPGRDWVLCLLKNQWEARSS